MSSLLCPAFRTFRKRNKAAANHTPDLVRKSKSTSSSFAITETGEDVGYITSAAPLDIASSQQLLRVHGINQGFELHNHETLPFTDNNDEVLIRIQAIGLNPIDWKAPEFGWGLPSLPCVLGRDFVGTIVQVPSTTGRSRRQEFQKFKVGDVVAAVSTDYRDYRKAAFQHYAVASKHNIYRLPTVLADQQVQLSGIGVAFVTAALTLGVCLGGQLFRPSSPDSPLDLLQLIRRQPRESLSVDVREECFSLPEGDRLRRDQWLVIWGAGSSVGFFLAQLAKFAGVKVIAVADATKSGLGLVEAGVDLVVHRKDEAEVVSIIQSITKSRGLYHGADMVGKATAGMLQSLLTVDSSKRGHLASIVGSPKETLEHATSHKVPVKLFHEVPELGSALMQLLEDLLSSRTLRLPEVHVTDVAGLQHIPEALQMLKNRSFKGQRIVVPI